MSVKIESVEPQSPAALAGLKAEDILISINGNEIMDVLDFRFYQNEKKVKLIFEREGKKKRAKIKKDEYEELGLGFETYLMDKQHSCKNKCIFCFIDQMPKGMRESLYFKDDDSRLSFLFGNYITLTNITEHEIERIIKMHISPINISVHTTNPELRAKMMNNRFAGEALGIMERFNAAGIRMNCQLVLVPDWNDGLELERSLSDLLRLENVASIAVVPVGLTRHREGLEKLKPFDKASAERVIKTVCKFGDEQLNLRGERVAYPSDEFYLKAELPLPDAEFYGDFLQLENGVGMLTLLADEAERALRDADESVEDADIGIITGVAAAPTIKGIIDKAQKKWHNLSCEIYEIRNDFFGETITVSGLITAGDIIAQLEGKALPERLLIPSSMLRTGEDCFLDDITLDELEERLKRRIKPIKNDGYELIEALINKDGE